jgi:mycothiol synthase
VSCAADAQVTGLRLERARRLGPELQSRVRALAAAALAQDGVRPFGEHKWLRLIRGDDRFVALLLWDGPSLIGAAHCYVYRTWAPKRPCRLVAELVVHPERRGAGLGARLLGTLLELARDEGADEVHAWAYGNLPPAQQLARRFELRAERVLLQYELERQQLPTRVAGRPDVRLRPFEAARDAYAWLGLHNRVFAGHPEQGTWDASDLQLRLEQPWFDARAFLIAEDAHTAAIVGFCWVKLPLDSQQAGEIYIVGVDPAVRGRGLGEFLARAGLAHIRAAGRPAATLYVEANNAPARALYEHLGFQQRSAHVCYRR